MRLIDADELLKPEHLYYAYRPDEYYVPVRDIEDAPTIERSESRWIPCSERTPDNDVRVLMCTGKGYIHVGERDNRDIWNVGGYYLYEDCEVAAWMPLPKPYRPTHKGI